MPTTATFTESDAYRLLDQALSQAPGGLKIQCGTNASATSLRYRLNYFRKIDRERTKGEFPVGDPRHGRSAYDALELVISKDDNCVVHIRGREVIKITIIDPDGKETPFEFQ